MSADSQIFISYAHLDNRPLSEQEQGWITRFHASLKALLEMRLAGRLSIWRDEKLSGNDIFADEILDQLKGVRLLISIMSPSYVDSKWCKRELNAFCEAAEHTGGVTIDNKSRVIKVIKSPVDDQSDLPEVIQEQLGFDFFTYRGDAPIELDPAFGKDLAPLLNEKLAILAWEIAQMLKTMATTSANSPEDTTKPDSNGSEEHIPTTDQPEQGETDTSTKLTVFLAEASYESREARSALAAKLRQFGHEVLPQQRLPSDQDAYAEEVSKLLERCQLAIHLIGTSYVPVLDGPDSLSVGVVQNDIAVHHSREHGLRRVIWLRNDLELKDDKQREFVQRLHEDSDAQFGADLVTGTVHELEQAVLAEIQQIETKREQDLQQPAEAACDRPKLVYLICDRRDRPSLRDLRHQLADASYDVKLPLFEGSASEVRAEHESLLTSCDVLLIYYGAGNEAWRRAVESDLRKLNAYRDGREAPFVKTYVAEPSSIDKDDLVEFSTTETVDGRANTTNPIAKLLDELAP